MNKLSSILLVDDDETTNFVNQMLLEDMQVTQKVLKAYNGLEVLRLIKQLCVEGGECPQLILLDINMTEMDGFEFLEAYETLDFKQKQSVVIVVLTTSMNPGDMERIKKMSINGFFNKPLTKEIVQELLRLNFGGNQPS